MANYIKNSFKTLQGTLICSLMLPEHEAGQLGCRPISMAGRQAAGSAGSELRHRPPPLWCSGRRSADDGAGASSREQPLMLTLTTGGSGSCAAGAHGARSRSASDAGWHRLSSAGGQRSSSPVDGRSNGSSSARDGASRGGMWSKR